MYSDVHKRWAKQNLVIFFVNLCVLAAARGVGRGRFQGEGGHLLLPPHSPTALLPRQCSEHISLQKKSLYFVWLITYGHHCTPRWRGCCSPASGCVRAISSASAPGPWAGAPFVSVWCESIPFTFFVHRHDVGSVCLIMARAHLFCFIRRAHEIAFTLFQAAARHPAEARLQPIHRRAAQNVTLIVARNAENSKKNSLVCNNMFTKWHLA